MAKVAFSKLGLTVPKEIKILKWNDVEIEVKQYLPSNEKLELCAKILNEVVDDQGYYNPGKLEIFRTVEIILAYTNISVTEKQKEDICKLYDLFNGEFKDAVFETINYDELDFIIDTLHETIHAIYEYKNSVYGILDTITADYEGLNFDATKIQEKLANSENVEFLKEVMDKLG